MPDTITSPYQSALEHIDVLALDDQEALIEEAHYRLIDRRRSEIARNAEETLSRYRQGRAETGTVADLRRAMAGEA
jgi:hypothetical protein